MLNYLQFIAAALSCYSPNFLFLSIKSTMGTIRWYFLQQLNGAGERGKCREKHGDNRERWFIRPPRSAKINAIDKTNCHYISSPIKLTDDNKIEHENRKGTHLQHNRIRFLVDSKPTPFTCIQWVHIHLDASHMDISPPYCWRCSLQK